MNLKIKPKETISLIGMTATKLYFGDVFLGHHYCTTGKTFEIKADDFLKDFILDSESNLYKLRPEHDDDFYAVVVP